MATGKPNIVKIFGGPDGEEQNALWTAVIECGKDYAAENDLEATEFSCYYWLKVTPRTTFVCSLIEKLHELGYEVRAKV